MQLEKLRLFGSFDQRAVRTNLINSSGRLASRGLVRKGLVSNGSFAT